MLAQISSRASSLGEESRVIIGQTNSESQTDSTDESGSVCVSMGASHRLHMKRVSEPPVCQTGLVLRIMRQSWVEALQALGDGEVSGAPTGF
jgi:hypothetical protein